jgi:hypothetical protein
VFQVFGSVVTTTTSKRYDFECIGAFYGKAFKAGSWSKRHRANDLRFKAYAYEFVTFWKVD